MPMSSGSGTEWLPALGASWQVVQVPMITGRAECVVEALDARDGDRLRVEQRLAARDRAPGDRDAAVAALGVGPGASSM